MLSLSTNHSHMPKSNHSVLGLKFSVVPSLILEYNPKKRAKEYKGAAIGEGDIELEAEIMDFMAKSPKPTMFPTMDELMEAGRVDLVEAIKKKGGWYSLGWDERNVGDNVEEAVDFDLEEFQRRVESCKESAALREQYHDSLSPHVKRDGISYEGNSSNSANLYSSQSEASPSLGRSLEIGADEDVGIQGILSRLEKQRNSDFSINSGNNRSEASARADLGENGRLSHGVHQKAAFHTFGDNISPAKSWRTWSNQQAGFQHTEFEAAEISFSNNPVESDKEIRHDGITVNTEEHAEAWDKHEHINLNQIRTRLQHLESELTEALYSLRSKREEYISEEVSGSSGDLRKLSDAWEFQQNEFMSAQERLRSIRAKLAVLEGKMALAVTNAQKIVDVKQKQIDRARRALQLLRTTCIVWPNSASEVFLAGSFDGWTTQLPILIDGCDLHLLQRKMEKSRTGIFSVYLKLYPGRYEIKFIVDGAWKIDPLRPIVNNNGYEKTFLLLHESASTYSRSKEEIFAVLHRKEKNNWWISCHNVGVSRNELQVLDSILFVLKRKGLQLVTVA
ncbi:UNVERIFIED_CONTAM: protein PTST2, chloroplastic [Sesamum angustifolium]|uniref:Protein PTST2, chloroplastic n=1 Tax=Sesamum angustifolium TaxID=2727405 RepID=A0AAW2Q885_9LAMI